MSLWDDQNICHSVVGKVCTIPGPGEAVLKLNVALQSMACKHSGTKRYLLLPTAAFLLLN